MLESQNQIPPRLKEIINDFQFVEGREKIELLIEYAESLPSLPSHLQKEHECMERVEECMTPVYVQAEIEDGKMHFYFDVPRESPTVRGFAAILEEGLDGASPEQVLNVPNGFFLEMGLDKVLTGQRLNGIAAILAHMKRLALAAQQQA